MDSAAARDMLFAPARLGPIELRNRTIKCATYETRVKDGLVTDELIAWHRQFAEGGVGMSTLAYCSASADGRTFPDQIWMRPEAVPGLRRFTEALHTAGARAALQLGHAGWFADPHATGTRPSGPSAMFAPKGLTWSRALERDDLLRLLRDFAQGARLAVEAGFDAIEVHIGHGYLLSQFLSPYNNRRTDDLGGSIDNRSRFPREVVRTVREAIGTQAAVYIKLNMEDGFRGGLTLEDGLRAAQLFEADGCLDAIQLTGGHTTRTPMFLMRGNTPTTEIANLQSTPFKRWLMRRVMPWVLRSYPFEEAFFLESARRFRAGLQLPLMLLGGITRLDTMCQALDDGFEFLALGRALIREPDLIERLRTGAATEGLCQPCNQCMAYVGVKPTVCPRRTEA